MVTTGGAASGATLTPTADPVSAASVAGRLAPAMDLAADPVATVAGGVVSATDPMTDQDSIGQGGFGGDSHGGLFGLHELGIFFWINLCYVELCFVICVICAVLVDGSMMVCAVLGMFLDLWWCGCNEERLDVSA